MTVDLAATIAPKSDQPAKRNGPRPLPLSERIERNSLIVASGCWVWLGASTKGGYGLINVRQLNKCAHRVSYETYIGPIPDGLTIDHLCRFTLCVNPAHLEPVSITENILRGQGPSARQARQTCCPKCGGEYSRHSTCVRGRVKVYRRCRRCATENNKRWWSKHAQTQGCDNK